MRVALIEDHQLFRDFLRRLLLDEFNCSIVGETASAAEGVEIIARTKPDIAILDWRLPDGDGFDVLRAFRATGARPGFLVVSCHVDPLTTFLADTGGVNGYVDKNVESAEGLVAAVRSVHAGRSYFSPAYQGVRLAILADHWHLFRRLTDREVDVLRLIVTLCSDIRIGERLGISPETAKKHRSNILQKANLPNTAKLVEYVTTALKSERIVAFGMSS